MVPLVIIRPEPGNAASTAMAQSLRMKAHGFPLFDVVPRSWEAVPSARADALLIGSANVFRYGGRGLGVLKSLPVYAVGEVTAAAAWAAGFVVATTGTGTLQSLLSELDGAHRRLLRLAGEERVALSLPSGVTIEERVVYASVALPFPAELAALLREPAIIALHSAEAARHLSTQCVTHGIRRAPLRIAALSARISAAAGDGWGDVAASPYPDDKALLALARQMCQDPWPAGRIAGN